MVINPIEKALEVLSAANRAKWIQNQKTSTCYYDSLELAASTNNLEFFTKAGNHEQPTETNLTQNRLDNGKMIAISQVDFSIFTKTPGGGGRVNGYFNLDERELFGLIAGNFTLNIAGANKIEDYPLHLSLPEFNVSKGMASTAAVVNSTGNITRMGCMSMALATPIFLVENQNFFVQLKSSGFTGASTDTFIRCAISGLGVIPNATNA